VVNVQTNASEFCVYGSALYARMRQYKFALYKHVKPKIITIGSSRVMEFRGGFFSKSFVNMGGVLGAMHTTPCIIDQILSYHKPELIVLGLDFWRFLPWLTSELPACNMSPENLDL